MTKIANYLLKKELFKEKYLLNFFYIIIVLAIMISFFCNTQIVQASDRKVSILYFNNVTHESVWDWLSKGLSDMLTDDLSQFDVLVYSSHQEIEDLYHKYDLSPVSAEIDKSLLIQFSEDIGAEVIFFGDFYLSSPSSLILSLKKYDNSTGEITAFRDFVAGKTDIFDLKEKVTLFILKELNVELSIQDKDRLKKTPTTSL
ncbi:MAG: hypothetical protein U9R12_05395, partial [Candidatus Caldatribacteriota bacterium]|nr:hypothetical protein [Candidatus Caldatribacteriota bacterium]